MPEPQTMKIVIQYDDGEWPVLAGNPPERSLDELLDTFTQRQVRDILNQALDVFRGLCDVWNQRELAARRRVEGKG